MSWMTLYVSVIVLAKSPSIFAVSCENKIRLADLQDIIKNQTRLIQDQRQINKDQENMIKTQSKLMEDLRKRIESGTTGKSYPNKLTNQLLK